MIGKYSNPGQFNPRHNLLDNLAHEPKPLRHIKLEQRQDGTTSSTHLVESHVHLVLSNHDANTVNSSTGARSVRRPLMGCVLSA